MSADSKKGGGIVKVEPPCLHPSHDPPMHMVFPTGLVTWRCPGCGREITFSSGFTC